MARCVRKKGIADSGWRIVRGFHRFAVGHRSLASREELARKFSATAPASLYFLYPCSRLAPCRCDRRESNSNISNICSDPLRSLRTLRESFFSAVRRQMSLSARKTGPEYSRGDAETQSREGMGQSWISRFFSTFQSLRLCASARVILFLRCVAAPLRELFFFGRLTLGTINASSRRRRR
jgi:hypothetical protein